MDENPRGQEYECHKGTLREYGAGSAKRRVERGVEENKTVVRKVGRLEQKSVQLWNPVRGERGSAVNQDTAKGEAISFPHFRLPCLSTSVQNAPELQGVGR